MPNNDISIHSHNPEPGVSNFSFTSTLLSPICYILDPEAAPPTCFRLAGPKYGWLNGGALSTLWRRRWLPYLRRRIRRAELFFPATTDVNSARTLAHTIVEFNKVYCLHLRIEVNCISLMNSEHKSMST